MDEIPQERIQSKKNTSDGPEEFKLVLVVRRILRRRLIPGRLQENHLCDATQVKDTQHTLAVQFLPSTPQF
jgi:hypothetical protein